MLDPRVLDVLDGLSGESLKTKVFRVTWVTRDPLAGGAGGGRWSPSNQFEVLYTSLKAEGALAEAYYHLSRAPVFSSSSMKINQIAVRLHNVLKLDIKKLNQLGIPDPLASRVDMGLTQSIGEAAHLIDYQGLLVPSARFDCNNLVVFMDRIDPEKQLKLSRSDDVNWPAWREQIE